MFIPDGQSGVLYQQPPQRFTLVGWLDAEHETPRAPAPPEAVDRLWRYAGVRFRQTRGLHRCPFCCCGHWFEHNGQRLVLGSAEMAVFDTPNHVFLAPNLIFHYVAAHDYRPPEAFWRALMEEPAPPDSVYFARMERLQRIHNHWQWTVADPVPAGV